MSLSRSPPIAGLALFAVMFQAVLFGWHHHELSLSRHLPAPIVENPASTAPFVDDEDGCDICQALHHLTAAPVDIVAAPLPHLVENATMGQSGVCRFPTVARAFHARGPPSLDAAVP